MKVYPMQRRLVPGLLCDLLEIGLHIILHLFDLTHRGGKVRQPLNDRDRMQVYLQSFRQLDSYAKRLLGPFRAVVGHEDLAEHLAFLFLGNQWRPERWNTRHLLGRLQITPWIEIAVGDHSRENCAHDDDGNEDRELSLGEKTGVQSI